MHSEQSKTSLYLLIILLISVIMIFFYGKIDPYNPAYAKWDLHYYKQIAEILPQAPQKVPEPFCYRILGPFLAGILPFPMDNSFYLLSIFSSLILAPILFLFLKMHHISDDISLFATLFLIFNKYVFGFNVWNPYQINDVLSSVLLILMLWAVEKNRFLLFAIAALVSVLARETLVLLIPAVIVLLIAKKKVQHNAIQVLFSLIPSMVCFALLRFIIKAPSSEGIAYYPNAFLEHVPKILSYNTWFRILINAFAPLSIIPFIFYNRTKEFFNSHKHLLVYLILVLISSFFGGDTERLVAPLFPVFYLLISYIIQQEKDVFTKSVIGTILLAALVNSFHHSIARFPLFPRNGIIILTVCTTLLVTLLPLMGSLRLKKTRTA